MSSSFILVAINDGISFFLFEFFLTSHSLSLSFCEAQTHMLSVEMGRHDLFFGGSQLTVPGGLGHCPHPPAAVALGGEPVPRRMGPWENRVPSVLHPRKMRMILVDSKFLLTLSQFHPQEH